MFAALARLHRLGNVGASFVALLILFPAVWAYCVAREFLNFCAPPGRPIRLPEWAKRALYTPHVAMGGGGDLEAEKQ